MSTGIRPPHGWKRSIRWRDVIDWRPPDVVLLVSTETNACQTHVVRVSGTHYWDGWRIDRPVLTPFSMSWCGREFRNGHYAPVDVEDELFACATCLRRAENAGVAVPLLVPTDACSVTGGRRYRKRKVSV